MVSWQSVSHTESLLFDVVVKRNFGVGQFNASNVAVIAHGLSAAAVITLDKSYTTTIYFIYWV